MFKKIEGFKERERERERVKATPKAWRAKTAMLRELKPKAFLLLGIVAILSIFTIVHASVIDDSNPPILQSFTSSPSTGSFTVGAVINVYANFDEDVDPASTMSVTLDTGATITLDTTNANGCSVSTTQLCGAYTVGAGENSSDLTISTLNSANITDLDSTPNNSTSYSIPGGQNLADNSSVVVDTTAPTLSSADINSTTLTLTYNEALDTGSVPDTTDFVVNVNGSPVIVNSPVAVSGTTVVLTLASAVVSGDMVTLDYTSGASPIQDSVGNDAGALSGQSITNESIAISNGYINGASVILVYNKSLATSSTPFPSDILIKINDAPIAVSSVTVAGTTIRLSLASPASASDTVTAGYTIGTNPIKDLLGNNAQSFTGLNIVNDSNTCSIIHTTDPQFSITLKNKLFVLGQTSNNVYAIDPITNTVIATILVGLSTYFTTASGHKVYTNNSGSSDVSVIDTATDSVIATIPVGTGAQFFTVVSGKIYVFNQTSNTISVINTNTDAFIYSIVTGTNPRYSSIINHKMYVSNSGSNSVSVIDTATDSVLNLCSPNLLSLTSTASNATYTNGQSVNITANFNKSLGSGSKMRLTLNTSRTVDLTTVSGTTLSGTYTVQSGDSTPDLSVSSIDTNPSNTLVSDTSGTPNTNSSYSVPTSPDLTGDTPRNLGDLKNISIGTPPLTIPTGTNPYQMVTVGDYTYVANQGSDNVTIFNNTTNTVVGTTTVGSQPYGMAYSTSTREIYVANLKGNSVSVIDADPASGTWKQVTNTITSGMGVEPYYVASLGTKIYVTNNLSWTVSEINTATHAVTATINVGANPRGIKALGSKLYVANFGSQYGGQAQGTVSIIDTSNSNAVTTVNVGSGPRGVAVNGTDVYVANFNDNTVSRIDTGSGDAVTTISVGTNPRGMLSLNNKIYVENYQDGTISIIDGTTHAVTGPYKVGNTPAGMAPIGNDVAISRFTDNVVDIFDTTNLVLKTAADVTAPIISSVASSTTQTTATITWTTDETATSTVNYGTTSGYGTASTSSSLVTSHSITLTGLTAGTTYHFQVASADASGNVATSSDQTFTTTANTNNGGGGSGGSSGGSTGGGSVVAYATQPVIPSNVIPNSPLITFSFTTTLKQGDKGNDQILELQKFLNTHGLPVAKTGAGSLGYETTFFGPATKKALILFQVTHGIKPSVGVFGPLTRKAINDILAKETNATTTTISPLASTTPLCTTSIYLTAPVKYGARNNPADVKLLENFLNTYEGTNLPVTGIYSKADYDAVVKFQEKYASTILNPWGLKKGTGYVFTTTLNQIKQVVEAGCKK